MSEALAVHTRPDIDIEKDAQNLMRHYPPLTNDRRRVSVTSQDGVVTVSGHVKSTPTYLYLLDHVAAIHGVKEVVNGGFYIDEEIRLNLGSVVPPGVNVNVEYGAVILAGRLPEDVNIEDLVREVALIPGVNRVLTVFS